jgi:hypothetical protein
MSTTPQAIDLISLLTHRSFLVRAMTGTIIGALIFFSVWTASLAWLPDGPANHYLFHQPSFFKMQIEKVHTRKEFRPNLDAMIGLCIALLLIAWGAVVEMMPY